MQPNPPPSKVALITGSARRIGAEIARTLHAAGLNVILHYHSSEREAIKLCDELNQVRKSSAFPMAGDLLQPNSENQLITQAVKVWERLDVLINNASQFYRTPLGEVTDYAWQDLLHSNLKAPFFLAQAA